MYNKKILKKQNIDIDVLTSEDRPKSLDLIYSGSARNFINALSMEALNHEAVNHQYLKLQEEVRIFNSQKFGCQIKFRISSNGAHARYYMDRNQVYRGTGDEQVLSSSIDDFQLVTKQKDEDDIRKTWKKLWTDPKCLPLPNNSEDVEAWKKILTLYNDKREKFDHEKKDIELIPKIKNILDPDESK